MPSRRTPACPDALERLERGQRRGRRRQRHLQPRAAAWRISSNRSARFSGSPPVITSVGRRGKLATWSISAFACVRGKLVRVRLLLGRRPAVLAHQVAGQRDLVVEHQRAEAEIVAGIGAHCQSLGRVPARRCCIAPSKIFYFNRGGVRNRTPTSTDQRQGNERPPLQTGTQRVNLRHILAERLVNCRHSYHNR